MEEAISMDPETLPKRSVIQHKEEWGDALLVERALAGEEFAFAELVRRHQGAVSRTVRRTLGASLEHEDAVQEVFLRAFNSLQKFDRARSFEPWVVRIATNYCIDQLRRQRNRRFRLWTDLEEGEQDRLMNNMSRSAGFEGLPRESPEQYERIAMALLDELKPKDRAAFVLREVEDRPYSEVAEVLKTSELGARIRVSRARRDVRRRFEAYLSGLGNKRRR
jgi:RNA polymerase sigma-70 factor (ECF subfamily)